MSSGIGQPVMSGPLVLAVPVALAAGVVKRDDRSAAQAFERSFGIDCPSLSYPASEIVLAFHGAVQPQAIPSTLVIDRQGRIAAEIVGASTYSRLKALLGRVTGCNC